MEMIQVIVLALVQGVTEFLPVSSSAHLILIPFFLSWQDQGLALDVTMHLGTLSAVCFYFRQDLWQLMRGGSLSLFGVYSDEGRLAWMIVISTLPAVVVGGGLHGWIEGNLRSTSVIAISTIVFALFLFYADRKRGDSTLSIVRWQHAVFIGFMQALALIPGTSRAGITITAALLVGLNYREAARYSFLLAVPIILAASVLQGAELVQASVRIDWAPFVLGFFVSAVSAWLTIRFFLMLVDRIGLLPFVVYRIFLGMVLLILVY